MRHQRRHSRAEARRHAQIGVTSRAQLLFASAILTAFAIVLVLNLFQPARPGAPGNGGQPGARDWGSFGYDPRVSQDRFTSSHITHPLSDRATQVSK